jgi:hypothetical protein
MNIRARKLIMKNLFKIIACLVILLQLVLLVEKGNDLINYNGYLGLPKGSYGYPVPYHSIVSICCLITLFTINMLILIIKKKSFFYHTAIAFTTIYMAIIGYDLYLHRYSYPALFKEILCVSLIALIFTLLIPRFNDLNAKLNVYTLILILTLTFSILMFLLWFRILG